MTLFFENLRRYFREPLQGSSGQVLPACRLDILLGAIATLGAMVAMAGAFEPWTRENVLRTSAATAIAVGAVAGSSFPRGVLAGVCFYITVRLIFGLIFVAQMPLFWIAATITGILTWLLVRAG